MLLCASKSQLGRLASFVANINFGSGILAYADRDQTGSDSGRGELIDLCPDLLLDLGRNRLSVQYSGLGHGVTPR
jgi:hypothetical protein